MKKSLLNTAVSIAVSVVLTNGTLISSQAYAEELIIDNIPTDDITSNDITTENYMVPGMGIGATTGTLVAGPVGFVVGGLIGAIFGSNQDRTPESSIDFNYELEHKHQIDPVLQTAVPEKKSANTDIASTDKLDVQAGKAQDTLYLAQVGPINTVLNKNIESQQETLMNILVSDLSLDVYFRSGSTYIEKFYPARLSAIADLVNNMAQLELHLDGYTDRRGNKNQNIALANERIDKVRERLINAGVDDTRIKSKAFGEAKMKSAAGNLEAYTFDRRVVIRFERLDRSTSNVAATKSDTPVVAETITRF